MYWRDRLGEIKRADLDGSNIEVLVTTGREAPHGIALDVTRGKMYWTNRDENKIQRANLDGSDVENLITEGLESPHGIALDVTRGKMYWTNRDENKIQRANLDGSNIENLITSGIDTPHASPWMWTRVKCTGRNGRLRNPPSKPRRFQRRKPHLTK